MRVLMVGVAEERTGGMWTVSNSYLNSKYFCEKTNLLYVATSTNGTFLKRTIFMIKGFYKTLKILNKRDIDIVHVHMAEKGSVFRKGIVIRLGKLYGCKTVIHMHAGPIMEWYDRQNYIVQFFINRILNSADIVLTLGDYWKKQMARIVSDDKLKVLYNGVSVPDENPYDNSSNNIIFVGRINKHKGIYDLLKAIKLIDDELPPETKLEICGEDEEGNLEKIIKEYDLGHRINLLGWIKDAEKKNVYKHAAINVLPTYVEGLSMTVIESMANGIPTITTDVTTMPEVLGDTVKLLEPGDHKILALFIKDLIQNDSKRKIISEKEYRRVKSCFSKEKNHKKLLDIYSMLIK